MYNASKDSVISMLGNTLIPIFVFDRKKTLSLSLALSQIKTVLLSTHNICVGWDIKVRGKHSRFYLADLFVSTLVDPQPHNNDRSWSQILAWQTTQYFSHISKLSFAY